MGPTGNGPPMAGSELLNSRMGGRPSGPIRYVALFSLGRGDKVVVHHG